MPDLTPAQFLAATAADMRKVAEAATEGPWAAVGEPWYRVEQHDVDDSHQLAEMMWCGDETHEDRREADVAHFAAWDPDMARAVADWLEVKAAKYAAFDADEQRRMVETGTGTLAPMLAVCHAWWKSRGIEPPAVAG